MYPSINTFHIYGYISTYHVSLFLVYCALRHTIKANATTTVECFNVLTFQAGAVCITFRRQTVNSKSIQVDFTLSLQVYLGLCKRTLTLRSKRRSSLVLFLFSIPASIWKGKGCLVFLSLVKGSDRCPPCRVRGSWSCGQ